MKNFYCVGVALVLYFSCINAVPIEDGQAEVVETRRDIRDIFNQLLNADGFVPAPKPEELTEDFGETKDRNARSYSSSESHEHYHRRPHYGGYGHGYGHGSHGYGYGSHGYGHGSHGYRRGYGGYSGEYGHGLFGGIFG